MNPDTIKQHAVVGIFPDPQHAEQAVSDLLSSGIREEQVHIVAGDNLNQSETSEAVTDMNRPRFFHRLFGVDYERDHRFQEQRPRFADEDRYFSGLVTADEELVAVDTDGDSPNVESILIRHGGRIEPEASARFGEVGTLKSTILREEELIPHKERVQTGEVDIHKETVTETRTMDIPVEHEEVVIERRDLAPGDVASGNTEEISASDLRSDEEIRIPVSEEHVSVEKRTVPKEEIKVSKRNVKEVEHVSEELKHEEAKIETKGRVDIQEQRNKTDEERSSA